MIMSNKIRIHVIEARKLEGEFVRALVKVAIGNTIKETSIKYGTNNPFWDEVSVCVKVFMCICDVIMYS